MSAGVTSPHSKHRDLSETLRQVNDKEGLGHHLRLLHERRPDLSLDTLGRAAFPEAVKSKRVVIWNWLRGDNAPSDWDPLHRLVKKLGASTEEIAEFERAFDRIDDQRGADRRAGATKPSTEQSPPEPQPEETDGAVPTQERNPATVAPAAAVAAPSPASRPTDPGEGSNNLSSSPRKGKRKYVLMAGGAVLACAVVAVLLLLNGSHRPTTVTGDTGRGGSTPSGAATTSPAPSPPPTPGPSVRPVSSPSPPATASTPAKRPQPSHPPTATSRTPARVPVFGSSTQLISVESGLCVDGGVNGDASEVYQWDCAEGATNQQWHLARTHNDVYQIKDDYSGMCLGIIETPVRLDVTQTDCAAEAPQQWRFKAANTVRYGSEWYSGYLINSRFGKCLTLSQASHERRADIGEWDCADGTRHQMFRLRPGAL